MGRSKRMVRGVPMLLLFVILEHRKVGDPQKMVISGSAGFIECFMTVGVFARDCQSKVSGGLVDRVFALQPSAGNESAEVLIGFRSADQDEQVTLLSFGCETNFGGSIGKGFLQALEVLDQLCRLRSFR